MSQEDMLAYLNEPESTGAPDISADMAAYLAEPVAAPSPPKPKLTVNGERQSRFARVGLQSALKGAATVPDLFLNLPNAAVNLPKAAYGTLMTAAGRPDLAPDVNLQPNYANQALYAAGIAKPEYDPQTASERVADAILQGGVSTALSGKPSAGMLGLGAASAGTGQAVTEVTDNPLLGGAASILTAAAAPAASKALASRAEAKTAAASAARSQNSQRDAVLKAGIDRGLVASPSEMKNRGFTKTLLSSEAGKIATEGEASIKNSQKIHNMLAKEIGVSDDVPLTRNVFSDIRNSAHEAGYVPLRELGEITPDERYFNALKKMASAEESAAKSFPKAATNDARKLAESLSVEKFDASAAVDQISELRAAADTAFAGGNKKLGGSYKSAAKALEDALEAHLEKSGNKQLLDNYRNARKQIAKTYTVEDVVNPATGLVDAPELAKVLASSEGGKLTGDIKLAAEFAKAFPKSTKRVEQAAGHGISKLDATTGGLLGAGLGTAAFTGGASIPASLAAVAGGTVLPAATSALARKRVFSKGFQQSMVPNYDVNALTMPSYSNMDVLRAQLMADQAMRDNNQ